MKIKIEKIDPKAITPTKSTPGSNGYDVFATTTVDIYPGERAAINTGITAEIPEGYVALVCPRSGNAFKLGVTVINAPGVIDSDYRGEWKVGLINHGINPMNVKIGDKVAQVLFVKTEEVEFIEDTNLSETVRGTNGFGSTGR